MLDRVLLKAHHLGEVHSVKQLDVEDLLHSCLELQRGAHVTAGQVHHHHAAFELVPPLGPV